MEWPFLLFRGDATRSWTRHTITSLLTSSRKRSRGASISSHAIASRLRSPPLTPRALPPAASPTNVSAASGVRASRKQPQFGDHHSRRYNCKKR